MRAHQAPDRAIPRRTASSFVLAFIPTLAPTSLNLAWAEPRTQLNRFAPGEQSLDGAAQVMKQLWEHGVSAERLESEGYSRTLLLVENARDVAQRAGNRRVGYRSMDGGAL